MKRYAISDIHGCLKTFQALLEKIDYFKADTLYLLGDYIDRGPDSEGVISYIWELEDDGHNIHCLRGNHEQMLLDEIKKPDLWYKGEKATLDSFGVSRNQDIPSDYIDWMKSLPYYFKIDGYYLVHAGFNFRTGEPLEDQSSMIWIRDWYRQIDTQWLGERIVVHGHTPTKMPKLKEQLKNLDEVPAINIDAGCVFDYINLNHLCALNLDTKELHFQECIDD